MKSSLVLLAFMMGCTGASHTLPETYAPLAEIHERPAWLGRPTAITTVGTTAYVSDLDAWLASHQPGSVRYHATLLHEQVHAKRQLDAGLTSWLAAYGSDTAFMWAEEQRGWYVELRELRSKGQTINVHGVATTLQGYSNLVGPMVTYDVARAWVEAVLAGRWTPPE